MINYQNLDLRIQADGAAYAVHAQLGSQNAVERFDPEPWPSWNFGALERKGPDEIKRCGSALFQSLIRGKVRDLYQQGRGEAGADAARGLRIRILIDLRDSRLRSFLNVPWELLYDVGADANPLLALDSRRAIVRMIDSNEPHVAPAAGDLKRVLLVSANPVGTDRLQLGLELARAEEALNRNSLRPDVLRGATRSTLHDRIQDIVPQIVHFMGHGSFDTLYDEGALVLTGSEGKLDLLRASTLAGFFAGIPTPRLVILNACLTAATEPQSHSTFAAFASIAAALSATGLPAVIAMQSTIRDSSAIRFTDRLYSALVRNAPIEAALSQARSAISALDRSMLDWAVPVLYLRTHGGGPLLNAARSAPPAVSPTQSQPVNSTTVHRNYGVMVIGTVGPITTQEHRHGSD
jgi:hypothetical protein